MGRKGGGGGTAGGGRSRKGGNVTYRKVVPPFLQGLIAEAAGESRLGRRSSATGEVSENGLEEVGMSEPISGSHLVGSEVAALAKGGCTVIPSAEESIENANVDEAIQGEETEIGKFSVAGFDRSSVKPSVLHGGIEKKPRRVTRPSTTFKTNDRQRLSFAESDNESSTG